MLRFFTVALEVGMGRAVNPSLHIKPLAAAAFSLNFTVFKSDLCCVESDEEMSLDRTWRDCSLT